MIISVFIPQGGCAQRCSFCDQRVAGGEPSSFLRVAERIEEHLQSRRDQGTRSHQGDVEVAFYGATFTAMPWSLQLKYLDGVLPYLDEGKVHSLRFSTRPDAIQWDQLKVLRERYRLRVIELGIQSFDENVLGKMGREGSLHGLAETRHRLHDMGISVGFHMMTGAPAEGPWSQTRTEWRNRLAQLRPDFTRIHPTLVFPQTGLETMVKENLFIPIGLDVAVRRCADFLEDMDSLGIPVWRLGLQPNETLSRVSAGPFHPAFGELVYIERSRRLVIDSVKNHLAKRPPSEVETRHLEAHVSGRLWQHFSARHHPELAWGRQKNEAALSETMNEMFSGRGQEPWRLTLRLKKPSRDPARKYASQIARKDVEDVEIIEPFPTRIGSHDGGLWFSHPTRTS